MKVTCVYIHRFAAAVETRRHPELLSLPIVIGGFPNERKTVFECSAEAAQTGIKPGMQLRQAHQICPDAIFIPLNMSEYIQAFDEVLDVLDQFSPAVEADSLGRAFLDITGAEGLFGPDKDIATRIGSEISRQTLLDPRIGIASNKLVASAAADAATSRHPSIIIKGEEKEFLGPLPAHLLPVSEETKRRFDLLGLRTMGQIASLPLDALANQFGEEGVLAHKLANGKDKRPLLPRPKPAVLEHGLHSENPLETIDSLIVAVDKILDSLIPALRNRNQVCGQIGLCFHLDEAKSWHDSLVLKEPTDSKREMLTLLKHRLESVQPPAGITGIRLALMQLGGEEGKQSPLFSGEKIRQDERLKRTVKHLQARFGMNPLKKVLQVDPSSRIPERRSILTDFNP